MVFLGSVTAYANGVKTGLLCVPEEIIEKHGAVSRAAAVHMALGASRLFKSDISVAVTGIAGPGGGSGEKPVGLCYISLAAGGRAFVREFKFGERNRDRAHIRTLAASSALKLALDAADILSAKA
jgi:PncC family amidohydrolase